MEAQSWASAVKNAYRNKLIKRSTDHGNRPKRSLS
jgi:hypothetical protein